eukprot:7399564-Ditylum_brightwellii.AAC.1
MESKNMMEEAVNISINSMMKQNTKQLKRIDQLEHLVVSLLDRVIKLERAKVRREKDGAYFVGENVCCCSRTIKIRTRLGCNRH